MAMFRIAEINKAGLNEDDIPSVLPPSFITSCRNVRSANGSISVFGGHSVTTEFPAGAHPETMLYIDSGTAKTWFFPCQDKVLQYDGVMTDVTPVEMTSEVGLGWSVTNLSGIAVINHPAIGPMFMAEDSAKFNPLPYKKDTTWKDVSQSCVFMVAHKQFLFGFGITRDGEFVPDSVQWSAPADIGSIPPTWDHLDVTQTAGYTSLGGDGGTIIGAVPMRDSLIVYRARGITIFDFIGGRYVWRIRHMTSNSGLIARDAVVDVDGVHYFISDGDILATDGNTIKSIANNRIKKRIRAVNKSDFKNSYAVLNQADTEILFCVPTTGNKLANIAYVYNYVNNCWTTRDLPDAKMAKIGIANSESSSWEDLETDWQGWNQSWDDDLSTPYNSSIMAIINEEGAPSKLVNLSTSIGTNVLPFSSIIERTDLMFIDVASATTIQSIHPHMGGGGTVMIQVGSQKHPDGEISWKPPVKFRPGIDRKVDIRTTGLLHAWRVYSEDVKSSFSLYGMDIQYVQVGQR